MTFMTIMFMLSNYWEKTLLDGNNLILFIMFTDIYILLYMYHDFTAMLLLSPLPSYPSDLSNMHIK